MPQSVVFLPTCSSPMSNARTFVQKTPALPSAKLERFLERDGRPCPTNNAPHMKPRPPPTRNDMRTRRPCTSQTPAKTRMRRTRTEQQPNAWRPPHFPFPSYSPYPVSFLASIIIIHKTYTSLMESG